MESRSRSCPSPDRHPPNRIVLIEQIKSRAWQGDLDEPRADRLRGRYASSSSAQSSDSPLRQSALSSPSACATQNVISIERNSPAAVVSSALAFSGAPLFL